MTALYHPVTREELDMIKNDCACPEITDCNGCEYMGELSELRASGLCCNFKGANALMDEVLERPDPLALLEAWRKWAVINVKLSEMWVEETLIINELINRPDAVREQGVREGWWKE